MRLDIEEYVTVTRVQLLDSDGIGRRGFILQIHDSPEGFSAPEMRRSLVVE